RNAHGRLIPDAPQPGRHRRNRRPRPTGRARTRPPGRFLGVPIDSRDDYRSSPYGERVPDRRFSAAMRGNIDAPFRAVLIKGAAAEGRMRDQVARPTGLVIQQSDEARGALLLALSIVIPIYNEEGNIPLLCRGVTEEADKLGKSYEIICVNDGSTDHSIDEL